MAIINARWPRDLCPESCTFGRTRNDVLQSSPRTRTTTVIRMGRPLWRAECTWNLPNNANLARLRYFLEALDGYAGSIQIWNFASPYPYGLDLATPTSTVDARPFWTYLGNRSPFSWAGIPSHWLGDATAQINATAALGATSVSVKGLDPSKIAVVQGQYVQIGRRLYTATSGASSGVGGVATIPIFPGLLSAAAVNDEVRLVEAGCEMRLDKQEFDERARAGDGLVQVSASFEETEQDYS